MPPGTTFDLAGKPENTLLLGAYIKASTSIDATTAGQNSIDLPGNTLFVGTGTALAQGITLPAGTVFHGGYYDSSASAYVAPFTADTAVTLNAGDTLVGGATLPAVDGTGSLLTLDISSGFTYGGAVIIPSCTDQPAGNGMYLPAGTYSQSGIERQTGNNVDAGETITGGIIIEPGDKYYVPVELGSPLASATSDTATVTWNTSVSATEEVRYTRSDIDASDTAWENCLSADATGAVDSTAGVICVQGCTSTDCGTNHSLDITSLESDSKYYYRIYIGGAGQCGTSDSDSGVLSFVTAPACAGDFALITVSNEESSSVGNFGTASAMASLADYSGRLYLGATNESYNAIAMYKTDSAYGTVTTQGIKLSNDSFKEIWDMETAVLDGSEYLFAVFFGEQSFMMSYSSGQFSGSDLVFDGISYLTGGGTGTPDQQGFGSGPSGEHYAKVLHGGNGYIYVGTGHGGIAKLYVANSLDPTSSANCSSGSDIIACNFADNNTAGDVFYSQLGDVGDQISAITEYNGKLYVSVKDETGSNAKVYSTPDIAGKTPTWTQEATFAGSTDIPSLFTSDDGSMLYIGTKNSSGAQVWTYDATGNTWTRVVDFADGTGIGGTGDSANTSVNFIIENGPSNHYVYFGTEKASDGFEIWRTGTDRDFTGLTQMGSADCTADGAADSFGSSTAFTNARKAISIRLGSGNNQYDRLFISVQTVPAGQQGNVRVYRIDDE